MNFKALALTTLLSIGAVAAPAQAQTGWTVYNVDGFGEASSAKVIKRSNGIITVERHNSRLGSTPSAEVNCSAKTLRNLTSGHDYGFLPIKPNTNNAYLHSFLCN